MAKQKRLAKQRNITASEHTAIKAMLTAYAPVKVAKMIGRSPITVRFIDQSTSYEDYKAIVTARTLERQAAHPVEPKQLEIEEVDVQAPEEPVKDDLYEILHELIAKVNSVLAYQAKLDKELGQPVTRSIWRRK